MKFRGFTLIELLVVVAIIGILAAAGLAAYSTVLKNARDSKRQADLNIIRGALEQYFADQKYYPYTDSLTAASAINNTTGGPTSTLCTPPTSSTCKIYLNAVPADPINSGTIIYAYKAYKADGTTNCPDATDRCVKYCVAANLENTPPTSTCPVVVQGYNFALTAP